LLCLLQGENSLRGDRFLAKDWVAEVDLDRATFVESTVLMELHDRAGSQINGVLATAAGFGEHYKSPNKKGEEL
jgi:hypothetical protein